MCERCLEATIECPEILKTKKELDSSRFPELKNGFVYFFSNEDFSKIKIGYSKHSPYTRMEQYQKDEKNIFQMIAIWPVKNKQTERKIHKYFSDLRINGEWFVYDRRICSFLKHLWLNFSCCCSYDYIDYMWGLK